MGWKIACFFFGCDDGTKFGDGRKHCFDWERMFILESFVVEGLRNLFHAEEIDLH